MLNDGTSAITAAADQWKSPQKDNQEVCIPTNPGTLLHPGSCTPCAFVFRVAEGQVRNRCTNGDDCGWCHHPSHPRTRGRRQKNGAAARQKEAAQQQEAWADKNGGGGGSDTSTRDSCDRDSETKAKNTSWNDGDAHPKTNRSQKDDRKNGKSPGMGRDDRANAKNNRQRNGRDDRSKNYQIPPPQPVQNGVERCNTPEFDEQYACYPRPQQPQAFQGVMQDGYGQPAPIMYSCVPVSVAVPARPDGSGMPDFAGYAPTAAWPMHIPEDWNASYMMPGAPRDMEARNYAPQPYMMVPLQQPEPQWPNGGHGGPMSPNSMQNDGSNRSSQERA
jgi:hypothetical protein